MQRFKIIYRVFVNRRKARESVPLERRKIKVRDAEYTLRDAIDKLSKVIKKNCPDIVERGSDTVTFVTFSHVCNYRVPKVSLRLCRNKNHSYSGGLAACNEDLCPFMILKQVASGGSQ